MNHLEWKKQAILDLTNTIKNNGFRVFIAKSGEYGFYTNKEGSSVVSFQIDYFSVIFSGNHRVLRDGHIVGAGWRFDKQPSVLDYESLQGMIDARTPSWVDTLNRTIPKTLASHLEDYQCSSKFVEQ